MALREELERQGAWLFRRRSFLPFALVGLMAIALDDYQWPFHSYFDYALWVKFCFVISVIGLVIRCATVAFTPAGTSGRNTHIQMARQLNTAGMYSLVRHPLYLGNFLIGLGISLTPFVWWLPLMYALCFCNYYERIMFVEEAFLRRRFGSRFITWANNTPAFVPKFRGWKQPELPFSIRNVLRREYTGLMVVILGHAAVQFSEHWIIDHKVVYETFWVTLLVVGSVSYFVLQSLKKRTTVLDVSGR